MTWIGDLQNKSAGGEAKLNKYIYKKTALTTRF